MRIEIYCAMCGKDAMYELDTKKVTADTTLGQLLKDRGWITQQNGINFDIYCSKKCAA